MTEEIKEILEEILSSIYSKDKDRIKAHNEDECEIIPFTKESYSETLAKNLYCPQLTPAEENEESCKTYSESMTNKQTETEEIPEVCCSRHVETREEQNVPENDRFEQRECEKTLYDDDDFLPVQTQFLASTPKENVERNSPFLTGISSISAGKSPEGTAEFNSVFSSFAQTTREIWDLAIDEAIRKYEKTNNELSGGSFDEKTNTKSVKLRNASVQTDLTGVHNIFCCKWNKIEEQCLSALCLEYPPYKKFKIETEPLLKKETRKTEEQTFETTPEDEFIHFPGSEDVKDRNDQIVPRSDFVCDSVNGRD